MGSEHEVNEDNGYILTKLVNTFWILTVSGIGMQQNELLFNEDTITFTKEKIKVEYQGMQEPELPSSLFLEIQSYVFNICNN